MHTTYYRNSCMIHVYFQYEKGVLNGKSIKYATYTVLRWFDSAHWPPDTADAAQRMLV